MLLSYPFWSICFCVWEQGNYFVFILIQPSSDHRLSQLPAWFYTAHGEEEGRHLRKVCVHHRTHTPRNSSDCMVLVWSTVGVPKRNHTYAQHMRTCKVLHMNVQSKTELKACAKLISVHISFCAHVFNLYLKVRLFFFITITSFKPLTTDYNLHPLLWVTGKNMQLWF